MKKLIAVLTMLMLSLSVAAAERTGTVTIGGTDDTAGICAEKSLIDTRPVVISLDANATTGFSWNGFIIGGDSVVLSGEEGTYVADDAPEGLCGVGGKTYYTLIPVKPGPSIVTFTYCRPQDQENADQLVVLAVVDEEMNLFVNDVTESGAITGTVISVDADEHSAILNTKTHGEVAASFHADAVLPVVNEQIVIYTDGTMTLSIPSVMNVIAWETIPAEQARGTASPSPISGSAINGGTLVGVYYHCSGDEFGNFFSAGLDMTEEGTLTLTVQERDTYSDPLIVSRFAAADNSLARIAALVNEYHMETWYERENVIAVCDAAYPQLVLVIVQDNGDVVNESFSAYVDYTDDELEAWKTVKNIVLEAQSSEPFETYQTNFD